MYICPHQQPLLRISSNSSHCLLAQFCIWCCSEINKIIKISIGLQSSINWMFTLSRSCWPTLIIWSFFFHNNTKPSNLHIGILFVFHKRWLFIIPIHNTWQFGSFSRIHNLQWKSGIYFLLQNSVSGTFNSSNFIVFSWWLAMLIFTRIPTIVLTIANSL